MIASYPSILFKRTTKFTLSLSYNTLESHPPRGHNTLESHPPRGHNTHDPQLLDHHQSSTSKRPKRQYNIDSEIDREDRRSIVFASVMYIIPSPS